MQRVQGVVVQIGGSDIDIFLKVVRAFILIDSIFFFKQKTAYQISECDWSSYVCSSNLLINN